MLHKFIFKDSILRPFHSTSKRFFFYSFSCAKKSSKLKRKNSTITRIKEKAEEKNNRDSLASMYEIKTISHPTLDSSHPLICITSNTGVKYFVGNISAGSQRIIVCNSVKLGKLKNIFLTGQLNWDKLCGLPGFILTASDQGIKKLGISYSNEILQYLVSSWRYFVFRKGMDIECSKIEFEGENVFQDELLTVKSFKIQTERCINEKNLSTEKCDKSIDSNRLANIKFLNEIILRMFPLDERANATNEKEVISDEELIEMSESDPNLNDDYVNTELPNFGFDKRMNNYSTNYLIEFLPARGRFDINKAKALNIKPGRIFSELTNGKTVTLEDGRIIEPSQVVGQPRYFNKVLVLDIPTKETLTNLSKFLKDENANQTFKANWKNLNLVYYFVDDSINVKGGEFEILVSFLKDELNVKNHVVSHKDYTNNKINFKRTTELTMQLKSLQPNNYQLPIFLLKTKKETLDNDVNIYPLTGNQRFEISADYEICYNNEINDLEEKHTELEYLNEIYNNKVKKFLANDGSEASNDANILSVIPDVFRERKEHITRITKEFISEQLSTFSLLDYLKDNVQAITLGTGSAVPSLLRNVSSTIVRLPFFDEKNNEIDVSSIILDAGENTLGTIQRLFNENERARFFGKELKLIYLSHLHADHHLGIISLIQKWKFYNKDNAEKKLYIVAPWQFEKFLNDVSKVDTELSLKNIVFINCENFVIKSMKLNDNLELQTPERSAISQLYKSLNLSSIKITRAFHCQWSYCVTFSFQLAEKTLFKLSYSGDTRPVKRFAKIGQNSDLLIHEATLEDNLQAAAIEKKHCTISEALKVGKWMKCKKLILTHFSQRYPKIPELNDIHCEKVNNHNEESLANIEDDNSGDYYNHIPTEFAFDGLFIDFKDIGTLQRQSLGKLNEFFRIEAEIEDMQKQELQVALKNKKKDKNKRQKIEN